MDWTECHATTGGLGEEAVLMEAGGRVRDTKLPEAFSDTSALSPRLKQAGVLARNGIEVFRRR